MRNKEPYEEKYGRHSSFRASRESDSSRLPLGKWLFVVFLVAFAVLGLDRWRKRSHTPSPVISEAVQTPTATTAQSPVADEQKPTPAEQEDAQLSGDGIVIPAAPDSPPIPAQAIETAPKPVVPAPKKEIEVRYELEKSHNHFIGRGLINGKEVLMMADTGASTVVVPIKIAQRVGLKKGAPVAFNTAGGSNIINYMTALDTLALGRIELSNVPAVINPQMNDDFILLGMSALSLMDMEIEDGKMVLKHKLGPAPSDMRTVEEEPFKRSVKDCTSQGNKFDKQTLDCLRGR